MAGGATNSGEQTQRSDAGPLTLRVLGAVSADAGGTSLGLGGPKQKAVLAMLIAAAGQSVSADVIAQAVYGDDAPPRARRRVQTYVSTLRGILGGIIVRQGQGWAIEIDVDCIDAARFERTVVGARALDSTDASGALAEVLQLWKGRPYADIESHGHLDAEIARLEELRLQALEARIEADLQVGSSADLVPELAALLAAHPYREQLRSQHMVALYRAGRQREALRSYEELRNLLVEELGVDPTPELRNLEQRILQQDETLLASPQSAGRPLRGYRLLEQIGSGAFSIVWRGVQPSVKRDVAVKQIRGELASRPEFIRRFEAEAHLVARLEHPHIVPLIDFWRDPDSAYLVMRWLRGGTVERALDDGPWSIDQTLRMARQVGAALYEAHSHGVIHRDVKTANILLDERGNAFLGDFGIALEVASSDGPEAALSQGSPAYAAPEQLRKEPLGPQADIFSLAVVLYECLAGDLPFPDVRTVAEMVRRQLDEPYPNLTLVRSDVPVEFAQAIARATAKSPADRFASILDFVDALEPASARSATAAVVTSDRGRATLTRSDLTNPYKGLRSFDEGDALEFFGRERLVDELVAQLAGNDLASRCLSIVGPSGSGKSSVVRAGLLPAIRGGAVEGSDQWFVTTMIPGSHPFESLEAALLRIAVNPPASLVHQLRDSPRGILRGVRRCLADDQDHILLVIDQFEEMFTGATAQVADDFLSALSVVVRDPTSPLRVVITLRADYYDRPLAHAKFASILKVGAVDVTPLAADELEAAITGPAHRHGLDLEPGLVARLTTEAVGQPAPLPLLQYTLAELFERRTNDLLTIKAYDEIGGLAASLALRAEELYAECSPSEQSAARRIFGRLINPEQTTADLRRRALVPDLGADEATQSVLDRYGKARLLTFDRDVVSREPTVEVAHEALLREWPRLVTWLDEDRELLQGVERLSMAADSWSEGDHQETDLYRGGRLETAEDLVDRASDRLRQVDRDFVAASVSATDAERNLEQGRVRRLHRLVVGVGLALLLALIAGGVAFTQQRRADDQAQRAIDNEGLAQRNEAEALAAAEDADEQRLIAEDLAAQAAAAATEADSQRDSARVATEDAEVARGLAEARALVASASDVLDEDAELAMLLALQGATGQPDDPTALRVLRQTLQSPVRVYSALADPAAAGFGGDMSSDGTRIVTAGDAYVQASDVISGEQIWRYEHGLAGVRATVGAAFVTDDTEVFVAIRWEPIGQPEPGSAPEPVGLHVLDAETGELKRRLPGSRCGSILVDDQRLDGNRIAIRSGTQASNDQFNCGINPANSTVQTQTWLIDVEDGSATSAGSISLDGPGAPPHRSAVDAAGTLMAVHDLQGVSVLDLNTSTEVFVLNEAPEHGVIELSADGTLLALGGSSQVDDRQILVFDVATGQLIATLGGHAGNTSDAHFLAGNTQLATTGEDGRVNLWDLTTGELVLGLSAGSGFNRALWLSDDELLIGTLGASVNVVSLDKSESAELGVIDLCPNGQAFYLAQGLDVVDGRVLAAVGCNADWAQGLVVDRATGGVVARSVSLRSQGVDISADGRLVAAQRYTPPPPGEARGTIGPIVVTDVDSGAETVMEGLCEWQSQFDEPGCEPSPVLPHALGALDVDFSPDGQLVTASTSSAAADGLLWDVGTGRVIEQWKFLLAEFTPDGQQLVTLAGSSTGDGSLQLRVTDVESLDVIDELDWTRAVPLTMEITLDGSTLLIIDNTDVLLYSIDPLALIGSWSQVHEASIQTLALSGDGTMVATVAVDGTARVRDLATGALLHDIQVAENDRAQGVAFANDDSELLVSVAGGPIWIYTLDSDVLLDIARQRTPRGFTSAECDRYFADTDCPDIGAIRAG